MDAATTRVGLTDLTFRLLRESFADAVSWVAKNLPARPAVPVLSGVLLTGSDNGLTISDSTTRFPPRPRLALKLFLLEAF